MQKTCILVADRARARFFVTEPPAERSIGTGPIELRELTALVDPEGTLTGAEAFSESHSGLNRSPHGAAYQYDDRRASHREELERRFAKRLAGATRQLTETQRPARLVLAVEPHLLGLLRQALLDEWPAATSSVERIEVAKDLSWHSPDRIRETLDACGALSMR